MSRPMETHWIAAAALPPLDRYAALFGRRGDTLLVWIASVIADPGPHSAQALKQGWFVEVDGLTLQRTPAHYQARHVAEWPPFTDVGLALDSREGVGIGVEEANGLRILSQSAWSAFRTVLASEQAGPQADLQPDPQPQYGSDGTVLAFRPPHTT